MSIKSKGIGFENEDAHLIDARYERFHEDLTRSWDRLGEIIDDCIRAIDFGEDDAFHSVFWIFKSLKLERLRCLSLTLVFLGIYLAASIKAAKSLCTAPLFDKSLILSANNDISLLVV